VVHFGTLEPEEATTRKAALEQENVMQRFLNWARRFLQTNATAGPPQTVRPQLEQLDERLVLSATSAITTSHSGWVRYGVLPGLLHGHTIAIKKPRNLLKVSGVTGGGRLVQTSTHNFFLSITLPLRWYTWQTHDLFAIDQASGQVVDFQTNSLGGSTRQALGGPGNVQFVSASVDPSTGFAEVFAETSNLTLWRCDSHGHWTQLSDGKPSSVYGDISATRDGQVYAVHLNDQHVELVHANGSVTDLGNPEGNLRTINGSGDGDGLAAGIDFNGGNEVFAIGQQGALYVYQSDGFWAGTWRLIDNSRLYTSVSATRADGVFAINNGFALFHWTEQSTWWNPFPSWSGQDITGIGPYQDYWAISADLDAAGQPEVYARVSVSYNQYNLFRYDQGSWQQVDTNVSDVSGADGGYFFDVNPTGHAGDAWAYDPKAAAHWKYLGSGIE
jgi:hypothetical protein